MAAPLLSLRGISKRYGEVKANQAVDLDVAPRSIHAILGENGAGKSTLMKLIYGVETPDSGEMLWEGGPLTLTSPAAARRQGIGMVFQHFSLFETLTVIENIRLVVPGKTGALIARVRNWAPTSASRSILTRMSTNCPSASVSGWKSSAA